MAGLGAVGLAMGATFAPGCLGRMCIGGGCTGGRGTVYGAPMGRTYAEERAPMGRAEAARTGTALDAGPTAPANDRLPMQNCSFIVSEHNNV